MAKAKKRVVKSVTKVNSKKKRPSLSAKRKITTKKRSSSTNKTARKRKSTTKKKPTSKKSVKKKSNKKKAPTKKTTKKTLREKTTPSKKGTRKRSIKKVPSRNTNKKAHSTIKVKSKPSIKILIHQKLLKKRNYKPTKPVLHHKDVHKWSSKKPVDLTAELHAVSEHITDISGYDLLEDINKHHHWHPNANEARLNQELAKLENDLDSEPRIISKPPANPRIQQKLDEINQKLAKLHQTVQELPEEQTKPESFLKRKISQRYNKDPLVQQLTQAINDLQGEIQGIQSKAFIIREPRTPDQVDVEKARIDETLKKEKKKPGFLLRHFFSRKKQKTQQEKIDESIAIQEVLRISHKIHNDHPVNELVRIHNEIQQLKREMNQ